MRTVLATIETMNQSVDLELSGDIAIGELIPTLVTLFHGANGAAIPDGWWLGPRGSRPLPLERTLISCDIVDGARLALLPGSVWAAQQAPRQAVQTTPSAQDTGGIGIRWRRDGLAL